jgi:hypothetical protein
MSPRKKKDPQMSPQTPAPQNPEPQAVSSPAPQEGGLTPQVIAEGEQRLQTVKNKGGRPKGSKSKPKEPVPEPMAGKMVIRSGYMMISGGIAEWRQFPGYLLQGQELEEITEMTDAVLKEYFPQLQSKHASLTFLALVLAGHFGKAYLDERAFRAAQSGGNPESSQSVL